jgi:hypothetical protein
VLVISLWTVAKINIFVAECYDAGGYEGGKSAGKENKHDRNDEDDGKNP